MAGFTPLIYVAFWAFILFILNKIPSRFLDSAVKRDNALTGLHCLIVPVLLIIYYLQPGYGLSYESTLDPPLVHLASMSIGFFIVSIFNMFQVYEKPDKAFIMHHITVGSALLISICFFTDAPAIYGMVLITQFTGVSYHSYVICRKTEGVPAYWTNLIFHINFYSWIFFRFVLYGSFMVLAAYYEWTQPRLSTLEFIGAATFLLSTFCFHIFWLRLAIRAKRNLQKQNQALSLANSAV